MLALVAARVQAAEIGPLALLVAQHVVTSELRVPATRPTRRRAPSTSSWPWHVCDAPAAAAPLGVTTRRLDA